MSPEAAIPFNQVLLGNKWETCEVPDFVARDLYSLSEILGRRDPDNQTHGLLGGEWGYGQEFENKVFEMHPYWWGDCECGFEAAEWAWEEAHSHTRNCFSTRYQAEEDRLEAAGVDWRKIHAGMTRWAKANGYPPAPQGMAVYCDCGKQEAWKAWRADNDHAEDCRIVIPNFRHKPSGYVVHWYKYIGRGMTANRDVKFDEWRDLYDDCRASVRKQAP